ncbi:hypothetical protein [Aliikangiella sp. IMCC44359]|uniref:hypothetical protein n=1 Tax=Aliikangiella sp. IMCC44359 TaxID=3459125 RepID=UPI00403AEAA8
MKKLFSLIVGPLFLSGCAIGPPIMPNMSLYIKEGLCHLKIQVPNGERVFNWHGGGYFRGHNDYEVIVSSDSPNVDSNHLSVFYILKNNKKQILLHSDSKLTFTERKAVVEFYDLERQSMEINGSYQIYPKQYDEKRNDKLQQIKKP